MDSIKIHLEELKKFILTRHLTSYDDAYWLSVAKGLQYLFVLRDIANDKELVMTSFYSLKEEVLGAASDPFVEDLIDELNAILIHYYPMPDFWTSTIDDFKLHVNFERYFKLLDKESHEKN